MTSAICEAVSKVFQVKIAEMVLQVDENAVELVSDVLGRRLDASCS